MIKIIPIAAVEQSAKPESSPVAVAELAIEEAAERETLLHVLFRKGKMEHHVRKVDLPAGERTADAPVNSLDRDLVGSSTSPEGCDVSAGKLVVAGSRSSKVGGQLSDETHCRRFTHGVTSMGWVAAATGAGFCQRAFRRERRAFATRSCLRGSNSESAACALKSEIAVLRSELSTKVRDC